MPCKLCFFPVSQCSCTGANTKVLFPLVLCPMNSHRLGLDSHHGLLNSGSLLGSTVVPSPCVPQLGDSRGTRQGLILFISHPSVITFSPYLIYNVLETVSSCYFSVYKILLLLLF